MFTCTKLGKKQILVFISSLFLAVGIFLPTHFCFYGFKFAVSSVSAAGSTWTGATSTDWNTAGNWSGGVPVSTTDVTIPDAATTPNDPSISAGAVCNSLTIAANGILNGNAQTITVSGNWANSGTFNHGNGTVIIAGNINSTFTPGASVYYNLTVSKTNSNPDSTNLTVSGSATVAGNLIETKGRMLGGQINLAGDYTIGASTYGSSYTTYSTVVNLNHASNNQQITGNAGGTGAQLRIDKAGGNLTVSSDIGISGWEYVQGTVLGLDAYKLTFGGTGNGSFVPGALVYGNIEINRSCGDLDYSSVSISGTATLTGNLIQARGRLLGGQINLAGNYTIGAGAVGSSYTTYATVVNLNHAANNQQVIYSSGGVGAQLRIDKVGGNFTAASDIKISGWEYVQGAVLGLDTYKLIFSGEGNGSFVPGSFVYTNIEISKTCGDYDYVSLNVTGTATLSGNLIQTRGRLLSGQINLAGNYIIGAGARSGYWSSALTIVNFNHASNNQQINYTAGGEGSQLRIDKAGGSVTVSADIQVGGWTYVQGVVVGMDTHTLTFSGIGAGSFTPGSLTYGGVTLNKINTDYDYLTVIGTLNINGNLALTDGELRLNVNNPALNISGNVTINSGAVFSAGANLITVSGSWTNAGTFNRGSGTLKFAGSPSKTFTPGASIYNNLEINKTDTFSDFDVLYLSGTATVLGNFNQAAGEFSGQINLAGNYIVAANCLGSAAGLSGIVNFNGTAAQSITYSAGGIGAGIRIDKTAGTLNIPTDITVAGWTYVQGTVTGTDTHTFTFGDNTSGNFVSGPYTYGNVILNKTFNVSDYDYLAVNGTATVSGSFTHTDGTTQGGQINVGGDYTIGAEALGGERGYAALVVNLSGAGSQSVVSNAGGVGDHIRVDKASGTLSIPGDIVTNSWTYVRGTVVGMDSHTLTFADNTDASFTPGSLVYGNITVNKTDHVNAWDAVLVGAGTLSLSGNLNIIEGKFDLSTNNPAINLGGNLSVGAAAIFTKGNGLLTFTGATPSTFSDLSATSQNIGKAALNKTSTTESNNKLTLGSSLTCDTLIVDGTAGQADTLELGNGGYTLTLANAGNTANVFTVNGAVTPGDSTIKYAATNSAGNVNLAAANYDNLELSGAETYALSSTTNLTGNLIIGATSILSPGTSTVTLNGANQNISGNTAFYNLTKDIASADTLTFAANSTTTINSGGTLTLTGDSRTSRLSLRSGAPATAWNLNVNASAATNFDYLDVQDSDASGGKSLIVLNSLNSGGNTNWSINNNTAPTVITPSIDKDSPALINVQTTIDDIDDDNTIKLKVEYSIDGGSTWHNPYLTNTINTNPDQTTEPDVDNSQTYQVGSVNPIHTSSGANTLNFHWDARNDLNELGPILYETNIKIRITPYDGSDLGTPASSNTFSLDNRGGAVIFPSKPDVSRSQINVIGGKLDINNLPTSITQMAVSTTSDFKNVSWSNIIDKDNLLGGLDTTGKLYFKFRTKEGAVSDVIIYGGSSGSVNNTDNKILLEGDIVKTADNFDVYIIKYKNNKLYKRLILSPSVFKSYQHLKWSNIKIISQNQMDAYLTSDLVQVAGDNNIYELFPSGDTGERRIIDMNKPYDIDSAYEINKIDRDGYILVK